MKDLPNSPEVEQAVLGILLSKQNQSPLDIADLREDDFYRTSHRMIFDVISRLYRHGKCADLVTVTEALIDEKKLKAVGGIAFITSLVGNVFSLQHLNEYAGVLRKKWKLRHLAREFDELSKEACQEGAVVENISKKAHKVLDDVRNITEPVPISQVHFCADYGVFPLAVPDYSAWLGLVSAAATSFVDGFNMSYAYYVVYSLGICSCSAMKKKTQEILREKLDAKIAAAAPVFLSDHVLSLTVLFASLRNLRSKMDGAAIVLLDSWFLFEANTMHPFRIARIVQRLDVLAKELCLRIHLAVHVNSSAELLPLGILPKAEIENPS